MGSYNIRGENAADTGDKDWNVRKEYVVRNIVEHDFDVVGYDITSFVEFGSASVFRKRIRFLCVDDLPALQIGAEKETSVNRSPKPKKTPEPVRVRG